MRGDRFLRIAVVHCVVFAWLKSPIAVESKASLSRPLKPAPKRRTAPNRRFLHDDEARARQILRKPLRYDVRHYLVSIVHSLTALVPQGEGERGNQVY